MSLTSSIKTLFSTAEPESLEPDTPVSFGYKHSWMTVRSESVGDVVGFLKLQKTRPANWENGIEESHEGRIFVSPPIDGWIFISGRPNYDWESEEAKSHLKH